MPSISNGAVYHGRMRDNALGIDSTAGGCCSCNTKLTGKVLASARRPSAGHQGNAAARAGWNTLGTVLGEGFPTVVNGDATRDGPLLLLCP